MPKAETRQPLPPYIPFKTFQGFIQKLKDTAIPERVDTSLLRSYSGSMGRQLVAALKFLGLLDGNNYSTEKLRRAVKAYGAPDWNGVFEDIFVHAYSELIGELNLDIATFGQLADRFKAWGADGQVLQKCIAFYLAGTANLGWTISPHITSKERAKSERGNRPRAKKPPQVNDEFSEEAGTGLVSSGSVRFSFPVPEKSTASIVLPSDLAVEDWEMIDAMIRAYIARKEKK